MTLLMVKASVELIYFDERQRFKQGFRKVVREFDGFHAQLRSHERKEQMLILQAYGDDIGCGD
jgi:hypothetical protein